MNRLKGFLELPNLWKKIGLTNNKLLPPALQTQDTTNKLEIICDLNKLNVKELTLIVETVQRCLKLPSSSISVKDVKKNCVILVCRIPENVKD